MTQVTDYTIANDTAANVRQDINDVLGAIRSSNSSTDGTNPPATIAGMLWYDGQKDKLKIRNQANDGWNEIPYMPAGSLQLWAGTGSAPTGWLLCDGSAKSTTTYADLFAAIAYTYGGSGSSFNVPNCVGRVVSGKGSTSGLTTRSLGAKFGSETHSLTEAQMPRHTHNGKVYLNAHGSVSPISDSTLGTTIEHENNSHTVSTTTSYDLSGLTRQDYTGGTGSSQSASNGSAHNIIQPTIALNYIIKI